MTALVQGVKGYRRKLIGFGINRSDMRGDKLSLMLSSANIHKVAATVAFFSDDKQTFLYLTCSSNEVNAMTESSKHIDEAVSEHPISEEDIDKSLEESFPASDPSPWTLGIESHEVSPERSGGDKKDEGK